MQNMQSTLFSWFILNCSTCCGWRIPWMLILLLSRGMGGKAKVVYDVWWYSYRKRAILSGSTDRTAYLPYSPAFLCNIVSHLNAWYPRLWIPPPASLCVKNLRILARFQMLMRMPQKVSACNYGTRIWVCLVPVIRPERNTRPCSCINHLPVVDFTSIFKSRCYGWKESYSYAIYAA